jgi:aminoglycoside phosphotransferase (APT) family kinase protein
MTTQAQYHQMALGQWQSVAQELGLIADDFELLVLRSNAIKATLVCSISGADGPKWIMKSSLSPKSWTKFAVEHAAHQKAFEAFSAAPNDLNVPQILWANADTQIILTDFVKGYTAHDSLLLAESDADRELILQEAGRWIGYFHQTSDGTQAFDTLQAQQRLSKQLEEIRTHQVPIAGRAAFLEYGALALARLQSTHGQTVPYAVSHGDFGLRNLMLGPDGVAGIDLNAAAWRPVAYDVSRFLIQYGSTFFPAGAQIDWFQNDAQRFLSGYGADLVHDPSFKTMIGVQLLADWRSIPKEKTARTDLESRKWKGLRNLAKIVFAPDWQP